MDVVVSDSCLCAVDVTSEAAVCTDPLVRLGRIGPFVCRGITCATAMAPWQRVCSPRRFVRHGGKASAGGCFSQHLWQNLPRGATKALLVCAGSCSAMILVFLFLFWRGSVWNINLLCVLPGNDFPGDPQDVAWHMQKMQEAR